jgi:uncharacterized protein YkwD
MKIGVVRAVLVLFLMVSAAPAPLSRPVLAFSGTSDENPGSQATLKPASAAEPDIPFVEYDSQTERELLALANQARARVGAPTLTLDSGLTHAARDHAQAMFAARQLSHQFADEPSLAQRLADSTRTQLDQEAENVALDYSAADAQQHLMLSPPHRTNLLNPAYNVVGLGVIRSGDRLYIVQDFGHALPTYSLAEVKATIAAAVAQARRQARQPALAAVQLFNQDDAACSMAQADKLGTAPVHQLAQRYSVLAYTSLHPEMLPESAGQALSSHNLRSFSVGACYARTATYPTGVYWVVLSLD